MFNSMIIEREKEHFFSKTIYPTKYCQPKKPFGMQMCVTPKKWFRESLKK
jgi:hypothetical protein